MDKGSVSEWWTEAFWESCRSMSVLGESSAYPIMDEGAGSMWGGSGVKINNAGDG